MDLRNKQITVAELLDNPKSKAVFQRRFGKFMKHLRRLSRTRFGSWNSSDRTKPRTRGRPLGRPRQYAPLLGEKYIPILPCCGLPLDYF